MELIGGALVEVVLIVVFILPIGAFTSALASCVMKCEDENH